MAAEPQITPRSREQTGGAAPSRRTVLTCSVVVGAAMLAGRDSAAPPHPVLPTDTPGLLARQSVVAPVGVFDTEYAVPSPPSDTTFDLRGAQFHSYHDKDAVYETNEFSRGSTPHQKNHRPIRIGYETPAIRLAVVGGLVVGDQPGNLTWIRMKYGQDIQDDTDSWVADGEPSSVDPYRGIVDNANQDGDPRLYVAARSWAVVDGLRVRNTHDGLGLYGDAARWGAGSVFVRNCWFQDIHDDAIENDEWQDLAINDCLFERVYSLISSRPSLQDLRRVRRPSVTQRLESCVVRLWPFPGGHRQGSTSKQHETVFKIDDNSPALKISRSVIAVEKFITESAAPLPQRRRDRGDEVTDEYRDVTIVWLGAGPYPGNVPNGCRLTTDLGVYERAVDSWKQRHGVVSFEVVDETRLLAPQG